MTPANQDSTESTMVDQNTFNEVSQFSHVGWGVAVVLTAHVLGGGQWRFIIAVAWIAYAAVKEFWWDLVHETPAVRGSSLEDFVFHVFGAGVGIGIVALA